MDDRPLLPSTLHDLMCIAAYCIAAIVILWPRYNYRVKQWLLVFVNIIGLFVMFLSIKSQDLVAFGSLIAVILAHWILLRLFNNRKNDDDRLYWLAFLFPIVLLIAVKSQSAIHLLGLSYLTFRMAQTVFELRGYSGPVIGLGEYLAFLIFPPTFSSGPISPFLYYRETATGASICRDNVAQGLLRILVGYIKYRFLANVAQELTFGHLWSDGFRHNWFDFVLSGSAYYIYLYLNFSGYTDIAIGMSAVIGIRVKENFDNPFLARNIRDFWRRWHMSLTEFVRDVVFTPLSMTLLRWFGVRFTNTVFAVAAFATFSVLAAWHGIQAGYFLFYGAHAVAFVLNQAIENELRRRGRPVLRAYMENPWIAAVSRVTTFLFISVTFAFFELQSWSEIKRISALMQ
jgi:D-alanyl-lipoteichoic acid acyltransferase DltB (MBOAT superfamily)